ncbi:helix-turn-helix transcriptional regulator [Falsigemmobacter faecalis]|uniref:AraC family transcriptional regulator n=1 Tax=Falsigemmobacter faecalis TaxID=2488730 RepID=A0A3P3DHI6_9RHOB|nr:AraC family transcriptional regulator [Falsigemmobacter faecalis]RRH72038.1 AraC family transcriptional regulator [Falsigemmobacter faecalis]
MTVFHYPGNFRVGVRHEQIMKDTPSRRVIDEDRILLMVLMNGHQRLVFEGKAFTLSTLSPAEAGPKAIILHLRGGKAVEYLESYGAPLNKISVSFDADWLAQAGSMVEEPSSPELHRVPVATLPDKMMQKVWTPDDRMRATAEAISALYSSFMGGGQSRNALNLRLMSCGIDLVRSALSYTGILRDTEVTSSSRASADPRLQRITAYIASNLNKDGWGPAEMAEACGLSLRSLQRLCLNALNCSPSSFIRNQRMDAALAALTHGGASIQQAAHIAGYSNTSNFATAFKRRFEITPGNAHEASKRSCARSEVS